MQRDSSKRIVFFILAIVFSIALMFAFIELPVWLECLLEKNLGFPGMDQGADERTA